MADDGNIVKPAEESGLVLREELQEIAREVEQEWDMGGLSTGLCLDFTTEVVLRLLNRGFFRVTHHPIKSIDKVLVDGMEVKIDYRRS